MLYKRLLMVLFMLVFAGVAMSGVVLAEEKEVKIALIYPVTGPLAHQSEVSIRGHQAAADFINSQGGIKSLGGAKIKFVVADTQYKPDVLKSEVQRMVQLENVPAILGAYDSGSTIMTSLEAKKYKVPMVSGVAAADVLTTKLGHPYFFRYGIKATWIARDMFNTYLEGLKQAGLDPKKHNKIALLYMDGKFGQAVAGGCKEWAPKKGLKIVADLPYPTKSTDLTGILLKLRKAKPDAVFMASTLNDAILAAKGIKQLNINLLAVFGGGGGHTQNKYYMSAPEAAEYQTSFTYWNSDINSAKTQKIAAEYKKKFNKTMDGDAAMAYGSTIVLADAIERAGSTDREKIREALAATNISNEDPRLPTIFGCKFDANGQNELTEGVMIQNIGGKRYTIYPTKFGAHKFVFPMPEWDKR
jgi:branched-chain amino acid transport system substrate-binding protein